MSVITTSSIEEVFHWTYNIPLNGNKTTPLLYLISSILGENIVIVSLFLASVSPKVSVLFKSKRAATLIVIKFPCAQNAIVIKRKYRNLNF